MQTMELKRKENAKPSDLEQVNNCMNWKMKNIKFIIWGAESRTVFCQVLHWFFFSGQNLTSIFICDLNWFKRKTLPCMFLCHFSLIFAQITYAKKCFGFFSLKQKQKKSESSLFCIKSTKTSLDQNQWTFIFSATDSLLYTVEHQFNKPLYKVLGVTNDFLYPSSTKIYKKEPHSDVQLILFQIFKDVLWSLMREFSSEFSLL